MPPCPLVTEHMKIPGCVPGPPDPMCLLLSAVGLGFQRSSLPYQSGRLDPAGYDALSFPTTSGTSTTAVKHAKKIPSEAIHPMLWSPG